MAIITSQQRRGEEIGLTSLRALQLQEKGLERGKRWRGTMKRWVYNFVPTPFPLDLFPDFLFL